MSGPVVTQADREAYNCLMQDEHYDYEPAGAWHFARHRQQAASASDAQIAELERELLDAVDTFRHIAKHWPDSFAANHARAAFKQHSEFLTARAKSASEAEGV